MCTLVLYSTCAASVKSSVPLIQIWSCDNVIQQQMCYVVGCSSALFSSPCALGYSHVHVIAATGNIEGLKYTLGLVSSHTLVPRMDCVQYPQGTKYVWNLLQGFRDSCRNLYRANQITERAINRIVSAYSERPEIPAYANAVANCKKSCKPLLH